MAGKREYDWSDYYNPPVLKPHTAVKHDIIREYLIRYFQVFSTFPGKSVQRINLIDGFAGGGMYRDPFSDSLKPGSPFVLMEAVQEAQTIITRSKETGYSIQAKYYFTELNKKTFNCLSHHIGSYPLAQGQDIHALNKPFQIALPAIIEDIKKQRSTKPHNLFLLDQCGYAKVTFDTVRYIFESFPEKTEVILTFSVDALINYLTNTDKKKKSMGRIGITSLFKSKEMQGPLDIKTNRFLIEQFLYQEISEKCGAKYYTPFFLTDETSNRAYWLIHMSSHPKARDEMIKTHYESNNTFVHHGLAGLNMILGYKPALDHARDQITLDFEFNDETAEQRVHTSLCEDIPKEIHSKEEVTFEELLTTTCNYSPASIDMYKNSLFDLQEHKELEVIKFDSGNKRQSANSISLQDKVIIPKQTKFFF